jgi:RNA polymerase primary sigma factor
MRDTVNTIAIAAPPSAQRAEAKPQSAAGFARVSDDAVRDYLQGISAIPLLAAEDEPRLARTIEAGVLAREALDAGVDDTRLARELKQLVQDGEAAYRNFVRANLRLVVSVAKNYLGHGVPFMDLIQEGNIGLDRAVKKFDYAKGYKFSTYATWWIRQSISRCIADSSRLIRIPVHAAEKVVTVRKLFREMEAQTGRRPSIEDIAIETGFAPEKVKLYLDVDRDPVSIHTPVGEEQDTVLGDLIEDEQTAPIIDTVSAGIRHDLLHKCIATLPERDAKVLKLRFGLGGNAPMTFDQVGEHFGISRERVRQIEQRAIRALRAREFRGALAE